VCERRGGSSLSLLASFPGRTQYTRPSGRPPPGCSKTPWFLAVTHLGDVQQPGAGVPRRRPYSVARSVRARVRGLPHERVTPPLPALSLTLPEPRAQSVRNVALALSGDHAAALAAVCGEKLRACARVATCSNCCAWPFRKPYVHGRHAGVARERSLSALRPGALGPNVTGLFYPAGAAVRVTNMGTVAGRPGTLGLG